MTQADNYDIFCVQCSLRYVDVINDTLSIARSFIDSGREYNYSRKDADRRIQNARYSEYKFQDFPAGWLGPEETKGAPEKSICLRWRSGRKPANPARKSQDVQFNPSL